MKKPSISFVLLFCLMYWFLPGDAPAADPPVVSVIFSSNRTPYAEAWKGLKNNLQDEMAFSSYRHTLSPENKQRIIREITQHHSDLVVTIGSKATQTAKEAIHDIPVVFCMVLHPEQFTAPNITGVPIDVPFSGKLQMISKILPGVKKIGVIYTEKDRKEYEHLPETAEKLGFELMTRVISSAKALTDAVDDMFWQINAFLILPVPQLYFPQSVKYVISEGLKNKVPVIGLSSAYTRAGALISFQYGYQDIGREAAALAAGILQGNKPGSLELSRPEAIEYSLNLDVARKIGLELPGSSISGAAATFPQ